MTTINTIGDPSALQISDFRPLLSPSISGRYLDDYYDSFLVPLFQTNINPFLATDTKDNGFDQTWTYVAQGTGLGTDNYRLTQLDYSFSADPNISIQYIGDIFKSPTANGSYSKIAYTLPINDANAVPTLTTVVYEGNILRGSNGIVIGGVVNHIRIDAKDFTYELFGAIDIDINGELSGGPVTAYNFTDASGNALVATNVSLDYTEFDAITFQELIPETFGVSNLYASLTSGDETYGAVGANTMIGGLGNDTYIVDNINDVAIETTALANQGGTDTVESSVSFSLQNNLDNLTLTGINNINGTGNSLANIITGNAGDNILTGGAGNDTLDGGSGNDVAAFNVNQADITVFRQLDSGGYEITTSEGVDTLLNIESLSFLDGDIEPATFFNSGTVSNIPFFNVNGIDTAATAYTGPVSYLEFQFIGSESGEIVIGSNGNDFMNLLGGDDAANGGAGRDVLDGGLGSNFLTGGTESDTFFLDGRGGGITWSTITDFEAAANFSGDTVSIFGWVTGTSQLLLQQESNGAEGFKGATLHYDLNGDNNIDTSITFTGLTLSQLPDQVEFTNEGVLYFG